jgi:hypothetical protein
METTPEDVRRTALTLPEVTEGTHFGLRSFKVRGRTFVTIQKGDMHAILHVDRDTADAAATRSPSTQEAVFRNDGRIFVGLGVDLAETAPSAVAGLVRLAWRNRAPKRLVVAHEAPGSSDGRISERKG